MKTIFVVCVFAAMGSAAFGQDRPARYDYLINATNAIYEVRRKGADVTNDDVVKVAATLCAALTQLENDKAFLEDLKRLDRDANDKQRDFCVGVGRDLEQFTDAFLQHEINALERAGLSKTATFNISSSLSLLRDSLSKPNNPELVLTAIKWLQKDVCAGEQTLSRSADAAKQKAQRWNMVQRWSFALGGVAVVAVDAFATFPSAGIAAASEALGVEMIIHAVPPLN